MDYILDQLQGVGELSYKKMFGEYALYYNGKVVALICDNHLFIKPTNAGKTFIGPNLTQAPAYPGAKPSFLIEDQIDDTDWLTTLIQLTESELPIPKPKKENPRWGKPNTKAPAVDRCRLTNSPLREGWHEVTGC